MNADREPDEELLASISDDAPADWSAIDGEADAARRARLESLKELAKIADVSRSMQREAQAPARERWGELLLLERLGAGERSEVYRAWDPGLRREVALKLMRAGGEDAALLDEGRALAQVRHPNVVTVLGTDRHDGRVGLWMELVRGATLEQRVRAEGPLDAAAARQLATGIGGALAAVHAAGLVHRDVKPANVVRDAEGRWVLADFGLGARANEAGGGLGPSGTPMYMAPELLAGAPATPQTDLYALGMLVWFALAGRHPFETGSLADLVAMAKQGPKPALEACRPGLPAGFVRAVARAIAPDPAARAADARTWVQGLESQSLEAGPPARLRPLLAAAVVAAALVAAFAALWFARREAPPGPAEPASPPIAAAYAVEASFLRRDEAGTRRLVTGDRVNPGDRLSLEVRASLPAWIYVLNEDERGERYLLFPQPRFDARNPLPADSTIVLPGAIGGKESAWSVTSAGGREHFLVVASPEPVAEIEAELERLPAAAPGRPVEYARVGDAAVSRLRGVGGVVDAPPDAARPTDRAAAFDRFRALAGRESDVRGVWVRQIVLENPGR